MALLRFEAFAGWKPLAMFSRQLALDYKTHLASLSLQLPTRVSELRALIHFFSWLIEAKSRSVNFDLLDVGYLHPSLAERNASQTTSMVKYPTVQEALVAFRAMPGQTLADLRDRALFGLLASTGIRIVAARTLRLRHVDLARRLIHQDPREVATKFRKEIFLFILDVEEEFEQAFVLWVHKLVDELHFGPDDPLFPKTVLSTNIQRGFGQRQMSKQPYDTVQMLEKIIKRAFERSKFPAYPPHRFRNMLVHETYARELTPAQLKAWSQNLGHTTPKTSIMAYGRLSVDEQEAIIRKGTKGDLNKPVTQADFQSLLEAFLRK